ncbi:unnamed protein product [Meganyctiphanes norvegica]|uniref:Uncharacterized protein n=1 Tax=Meganyctiphanes norvegica TaxID=48144 RepID=A0AAV2PWD2_MEGNR
MATLLFHPAGQQIQVFTLFKKSYLYKYFVYKRGIIGKKSKQALPLNTLSVYHDSVCVLTIIILVASTIHKMSCTDITKPCNRLKCTHELTDSGRQYTDW